MVKYDLSKKAYCLLGVCLCVLAIGGSSIAFGSQPAAMTRIGRADTSGGDRIAKIMSVLETRSPDRKVLDKAAGKLLMVDEGKLQLMSLLCDRIAADSGTAGADIAFSLITAMVVLS